VQADHIAKAAILVLVTCFGPILGVGNGMSQTNPSVEPGHRSRRRSAGDQPERKAALCSYLGGGSADYINVVDASSGEVVQKVYFSNRSHDTLYPLSGPIFQETKTDDGSGNYLYMIDPDSYAVSRVGPYAGILGPYAVDSRSSWVVNDVAHLWGMQVAELKSGHIVTANIADHPPGDPGLLHGIGWTPDETEVWQNSRWNDPHVYVWDMRDPTAPVLKQTLTLRSGRGSHWLTFTINGDYAMLPPARASPTGPRFSTPMRTVRSA